MLTPQQKKQYKDQGYLLVSAIFTAKELDRMEAEFDGIIQRRQGRGTDLAAGWPGQWKKDLPPTSLLHTHDVQAYSSQWTRVLVHDRFTETLADLIGPNVQLHHTKLFLKPPETGSPFPMHQDHPYFPHARHSMTAAIIHLTDASLDMGCVRVVPASHKRGPLPVHKDQGGGVQAHYLDPQQYPVHQATPCPAQRGDVLIFSYLTIHGSGINESDQVRKTVLVQVRDPADPPTEDRHSQSNAQGMMLRGVNPCNGAA